MFVGKLTLEEGTWCFTLEDSGLARKHYTRLKRLAKGKHPRLFVNSLIRLLPGRKKLQGTNGEAYFDEDKMFNNTGNRSTKPRNRPSFKNILMHLVTVFKNFLRH
jgi:hypothetical protein